MHSIARTPTILTFMSLTGECRQQKTPNMHHPRRRNMATSMVGLKTVTYAKISPKMANPRDITGSAEEEEGEVAYLSLSWTGCWQLYALACLAGLDFSTTLARSCLDGPAVKPRVRKIWRLLPGRVIPEVQVNNWYSNVQPVSHLNRLLAVVDTC